jgi:hypothetical protein
MLAGIDRHKNLHNVSFFCWQSLQQARCSIIDVGEVFAFLWMFSVLIILVTANCNMPYNNFTLNSVKDAFKLKINDAPFCESLPSADPAAEIAIVLQEWFPVAQAARTEKALSEMLVSPILLEARRLADKRVQIFSGEEFDVDHDRGLNGFCDFLFSRSDSRLTIDAPVLMVVEAKRGELESGLGQCVAEMVAAQIYNQQQEQPILVIYGAVTSGKMWQFLKLEGNIVTVDLNTYSVMPVNKILGILKWMLTQ